MDAERLTSTVGMSLARTVITADCPHGAARRRGAQLGQLAFYGATLRNDSGPALHAGGLYVDQHVLLLGGFQATGAGPGGAIRLTVARIGGYLDCTGATVRNDSGPAVDAAGLWIDRGVFLCSFAAVGAGEHGAVPLAGAQVRRLDCTGAKLRNDSGPALYAPRLQVTLDALLTSGFTAAGGGDGVAVDLTGARIGATLGVRGAKLTHATDPRRRLALDGLTYAGLPVGIDSTDWLLLLREGTPAYAAQPYQQLAAGHRAAGHDGQARLVLMTQRADQIKRRALISRSERAWARLTGLTLGYGYQPWRAPLLLLATVCTAVTLALLLGAHGGLARNNPDPTTATCSTVERIGVGLDIAVPLVQTGARDRCDTTTSTTGQALDTAAWALQLLAWAFATLFITGLHHHRPQNLTRHDAALHNNHNPSEASIGARQMRQLRAGLVMQRIALDHRAGRRYRVALGGRLPVVLTLTVSAERKITAVDVIADCDRPRRLHLAVLPDRLGVEEQAERVAGGVEHHPDVVLGLDLGEGGARVEGVRHRRVEVADRNVKVRGDVLRSRRAWPDRPDVLLVELDVQGHQARPRGRVLRTPAVHR